MISYLQIENLTKSFGDRILFENISLGIGEGDRIGLIAKNGAGKTTLLNILAGKENYDSGNIVFRNNLRVGYLEQSPSYPPELTVMQACFQSDNDTVRLIAEYEQALQIDDPIGLQELLDRMDHYKAWDYKNIMKDDYPRTCIVTTHRPTVLTMCDRVYSIHNMQCTLLNDDEIEEITRNF